MIRQSLVRTSKTPAKTGEDQGTSSKHSAAHVSLSSIFNFQRTDDNLTIAVDNLRRLPATQRHHQGSAETKTIPSGTEDTTQRQCRTQLRHPLGVQRHHPKAAPNQGTANRSAETFSGPLALQLPDRNECRSRGSLETLGTASHEPIGPKPQLNKKRTSHPPAARRPR